MAYEITQTDLDTLDSIGGSILVDGVPAGAGVTIVAGQVITVSAGVGYIFSYESVNFRGQDPMTGEVLYLYFVAVEPDNYKSVSAVMDSTGYWEFNIGYKQFDEPSADVVGVNNVYLVSNDVLAAVNERRFIQASDQVFDYGKYILGLISFPFTIPEDLIYAEKETIKLANLDTEVLTNVVKVDNIHINLGSISVPSVENNALDLVNTVCVLHLPYASSVNIDANYVIGQTVEIEYILDCYTGNATINISSSKLDGVILTKQTKVGVNVPYATSGLDDGVDNIAVDLGGDNGVLIPYIEVLRDDSILPYGFFTSPILDEDLLFNQSGFIKIEEIDLKTSAYVSEQTQIKTILKNGVIIK